MSFFREFKACECSLVVIGRWLGHNRNTLAPLMRAEFHLKAIARKILTLRVAFEMAIRGLRVASSRIMASIIAS